MKEEPTSSRAANEIKSRVTGLGRNSEKMILADLCSSDFKDTVLETDTRSFLSQDVLMYWCLLLPVRTTVHQGHNIIYKRPLKGQNHV